MKQKPHLLHLYQAECEGMIRELAKSEWFGVPIDMVKVGYLITEYELEQEQVLLALRAKTFPDFNPSSPPQVAKACQMLGFGDEILDDTTASGICTDKTVLTSLAAKDDFFPNIIRYRNLNKLINTYLKNIESDLGTDGNLRISWRQAGPETGRLSAPLLHQVPKTDKNRVKAGKVIMRDVFGVPDGYSFIYSDYCLAPTTPILRADLTWVPISQLKVGDDLMAIDETNEKAKTRKLKRTKVVRTSSRTRPSYRITMDDGRHMVASAEHPWLVKKRHAACWGKWEWVETKDLDTTHHIADVGEPWEEDKNWEAGYLAGIYDGEGWINKGQIGFGQLPGPVYDYVCVLLREKGYKFWDGNSVDRNWKSDCNKLHLTSKDALRFLGSIRPTRLMASSDKLWCGSGIPSRNYHPAPQVASIEFLGDTEVISIETECHTFIANGFVTHNSQVELRILGVESQDAEMLRIFSEGGDIHLSTTAEILGIPETGIGIVRTPDGSFEAEAESNRDVLGKQFNFGLAYGSQGHALVNSVQWVDIHGVKHNLTWDLLNVGMERWKHRFKGISDYTSTIPILARNNGGVIVNRFGRERRFGSRLADFKEGRKAAREAINFPIQSTATNITNGTIVRIGQEVDKLVEAGTLQEEYISMLLTVHDSIGYRCKNYLVPWFTGVLKGIGERQIPELDNWSFPMSIGVGRSWYAAEQHSKGIIV
jgi:DNA polymerase I-like protein with 3'-5' exonuclease and polymerase domains